jgi:hypothetical protein
MSDTHVYSTYGSKTIVANIYGRGLINPVSKTILASIHELLSVSGLVLTDASFEAGDASPHAYPEGYPSGTTEVPIDVSVQLHVTGRIYQDELGDEGISLIVGGPSYTYGRLEVAAYLDTGMYYEEEALMCAPAIVFRVRVANETHDPCWIIARMAAAAMIYDSERGDWYREIDLDKSASIRFSGNKMQPDYYYHYLTDRILQWLSYPPESVNYNDAEIPASYAIPFNDYKAYCNSPPGLVRSAVSSRASMSMTSAYSVSIDAWQYYR